MNSKGVSCPALLSPTLKLGVLKFILPQGCEFSKESCLFNPLLEDQKKKKKKKSYLKIALKLKNMYEC